MPWYLRQYLPLLREAVDRAPSIFSQRPWELELAADDRVELYSVPNEALADAGLLREAVISCGAALYNLRLAIRVAGRQPTVWLLPGLDRDSGLLDAVTGERTLLASVEVMPGRQVRPADAAQELYEALWLRRTDRGPYRVPARAAADPGRDGDRRRARARLAPYPLPSRIQAGNARGDQGEQ
jgi:hypothetical protein